MKQKNSKSMVTLIVLLVLCMAVVLASLIAQVIDLNGGKGSQGPQGEQGTQGEPGARGSLWLKGEGKPTAGKPEAANGDFYIDTLEETVYAFENGKWSEKPVLELKGKAGSGWLSGVSAPPNKSTKGAVVGDLYLDISNGDVYQFVGPKAEDPNAEDWKWKLNIRGDDGQGQDGSVWFNGKDAPAATLGKVGDYYLDTKTSDVYEKKAKGAETVEGHTEEHWCLVGNFKGATGSDGQGKDGTQIYYGPVKPGDSGFSIANAKEGDLYLFKDEAKNALTLYRYNGSEWTLVSELNGKNGTNGAAWHNGNVAPEAAAGDLKAELDGAAVGDYYLDVARGEIYQKKDSGWGEPLFGIMGSNGTVWFEGAGDPTLENTKDAKAGDLYLNTSNGDIWKFDGETWGEDKIGNIKGTQGESKDGATWFNGAQDPLKDSLTLDGDPQKGDYYLNTKTGEIYSYNGSAWTDLGISVKGKDARNPWSFGTGAPSSDYDNYELYDFYIDLTSHMFYQLKTNTPDNPTDKSQWHWDDLFSMLGPKGDRGTTWFVGNGVPWDSAVYNFQVGDLQKGDLYLNAENGDIYTYNLDDKGESASVQTSWVKGAQLKPGFQRAALWFIDHGDPEGNTGDTLILTGDFYLDLDTGKIWQYDSSRSEEKWVEKGALQTSGANWHSGTGEPTPQDPANPNLGDIYLDKTTNRVYEYVRLEDGTAHWQYIATLTGHGTKMYYGTWDPYAAADSDELNSFKATVTGALEGDMYLQTFYSFSGYTGFKLYVLHGETWELLLDMTQTAADNKYEIPNYNALRAFRDSVNGGRDYKTEKDSGVVVTLTGRFAVEDEDFGMIGDSPDHLFSGIFDGGNEKGDILYIEGLRGPLFGYLKDAEIRNLHLKANLDELTLATFGLDGKTSLLTNTFGIAVSAENTTFKNVTLELENSNAIVTVKWDGEQNVSVTVEGKPKVSKVGLYAAKAASVADYKLDLKDRLLELGNADFTFTNVKFTGVTYLDVTNAKSLTLDTCYADVDPVEACKRNANGSVVPVTDTEKLTLSGTYGEARSIRPAFIVTQNPETDTTAGTFKLTVKGSTILAAQSKGELNDAASYGRQGPDANSAAIYLNTKVKSVSITDSTFGGNDTAERYTSNAIYFKSIAENATFTFTGNTVYGTGANAFAFGSEDITNSDVFTAKFTGNTVIDDNEGNFLSVAGTGKAQIYLLSSANKFNDETKLYKAVKADETSFDFIAFEAGSIDGNEYNMYTGKVYLGSNFGASRTFDPEELAKKVTPGKGHEVWIIDLAFADPEGFVQHVADYTTNYYVTNVNGLKSFRDMVNGTYKEGVEAKTFENKTVVQTNDIDLNSEPWTPIGKQGDSNFRGTYNGEYEDVKHRISNLTINGSSRGVGLFGAVTHGSAVENLILDGGIQITGYQDSGALVGYAVNAVISNITINANAGSKITASNEAVGGVVGNAFGCTLTGITSNLDVEANVMYVGGIVGKVSNGKTTIATATYSGTVSNTSMNCSATLSGGIVGGLQSNTDEASVVKIADAHFTGTLAVKKSEYGIGFSGLVGIYTVTNESAVAQESKVQVTIKNSTSTAQYEDSQYGWKGYQFNTTYGAEGSATKEALISSGDALALVSLQVQFGYYNYEGIKLKLTQSVDMTNVQSWNYNGKSVTWYPIGTKSAAPFKGEFDGQSYEISGLTISPTTKADSNAAQAIGLFGFTAEGANIHDLTLNGVTITMNDSSNVGALIGSATATTVKNVSVSGSVSGSYNVGGLIGVSKGNTTVADVLVKATVTKMDATDATYARSIGVLVGAAETGLKVGGVYTSELEAVSNTVLDNKYTKDNLNYLVYNYGLVGSVVEGETYATDSWASGKEVLPAATVTFDSTIATPASTGAFNAHIAATDLDLSASFPNGTVAHGNASVLVTVKSALGLANVAELVNHGVTFAGETVALGKSVDMDGYQQQWAGIGNEDHPFEGTFMGIKDESSLLDKEVDHLYGPLFGYTSGAIIKDVKLGGNIFQSKAALVENATDTTIKNVTIDGWVQNSDGAAVIKASDVAAAPFGIVGTMTGTTSITETNITIKFYKADGNVNVTFKAEIDKNSNATVTYTGDTVTGNVSEFSYTAVINNEHFILKAFSNKTATYTFDGIKFTGDTYINVDMVEGLTVKNCYADVMPAKATAVSDSMSQQDASRSAFIVGTAEDQGGILLVVENNVILSATGSNDANGTAIFVWASLASGSHITNNTFGSDTSRYTFAVNKFFGATEGAILEFANNTMYGNASFYTEGLAYCPNQTHDKDVQWVVDGNKLDIQATEKKTDYALVSLDSDQASGATRVYITSENKVVYNGDEQKIGYEHVTKDSVFAKFYYVGYDVKLTLTRDEDTNVITAVSVTEGDFVLGGDEYLDSKKGYQTGNSERFTAQLNALSGVVAESADKSRIHIVLADDFGRRLSDLVDEIPENNSFYYIFSNPVGLNGFIALVNGGFDFANKTVKLADELNEEHSLDLSAYVDWTPIGTQDHAFKGTFDGSFGEGVESWTISGLSYTGTAAAIGFFGYTESATLKNLVFDNIHITVNGDTNDRYAGALVGSALNGTQITNVTATGVVIEGNAQHAGAIVGHGVNVTLNNVTVSGGELSVQQYMVGAVIGYAESATLTGIKVGTEARTSDGVTVTGANTVGGVVGIAVKGGTYTNITVYDNVTVTANNVFDLKHAHLIGGLVGGVEGEGDLTVSSAKFSGTLVRKQTGGYVIPYTYAHYGLVGCNTGSTNGEEHSQVKIKDSVFMTVLFENKSVEGDAFKQITTWDKTEENKVESVYTLGGLEALKFFRDSVNSGKDYLNETVKLIADIDMKSETKWTPIGGTHPFTTQQGNLSAHDPFRGTFTGLKNEEQGYVEGTVEGEGFENYSINTNAYTISNLTANTHDAHNDTDDVCLGKPFAGLFGYAEGANFFGINIVNATIEASEYAGALIGYHNNNKDIVDKSNIQYVTVVNVTAKSHHWTGGIAGSAHANFLNTRVYKAEVSATPNVVWNRAVSENVHREYDNGDKVGGLVGQSQYQHFDFKNNIVVDGTISGYRDIGGLAGYAQGGEFSSNTVKNTTLSIIRPTTYPYAGAPKPTNAEWMVGRVEAGADGVSAVGVNAEGDPYQNVKDNVTVDYGEANLGNFFFADGAWRILNIEGLETFRGLVNSGATEWNGRSFTAGFEGETVQLETDVELNAAPVSLEKLGGGTYWTPIGTKDHPFKGIFNGQNCLVNGLLVNVNNDHAGFFGVLQGATVRDLVFAAPEVNQNAYDTYCAGVLAGLAAENCTISNVTIQGKVSVTSSTNGVGVLAGSLSAKEVTGIAIEATQGSIVKGAANVGGVAGILSGSVSEVTIENLKIEANAETAAYAGGVAGVLDGAVILTEATLTNVELLSTDAGYVAAIGTRLSTNADNVTVDGFNFFGSLTYGEISSQQAKVGGAYLLNDQNNNDGKVTIKNSVSKESSSSTAEKDFYRGAYADNQGKVYTGRLIGSAAGLKTFRDEVNKGTDFSNKDTNSVFLIGDVDLTGEQPSWTPIGTKDHPFIGNFNGLNFTISNLKVSGSQYVGLFGVVGSATDPGEGNRTQIRFVKLGGTFSVSCFTTKDDATEIQDNNRVGCLVGSAAYTDFEGIALTNDAIVVVTFTSSDCLGGQIGGLVGYSSNCKYTNVTLGGTYVSINAATCDSVGGLVGLSRNDTFNSVTVKNASVEGGAEVGGVVGLVYGGGSFTNVTAESLDVVLTSTVSFIGEGGKLDGAETTLTLVGCLVGANSAGELNITSSSVTGVRITRTPVDGEAMPDLVNGGSVGGVGHLNNGGTKPEQQSVKIAGDCTASYSVHTKSAKTTAPVTPLDEIKDYAISLTYTGENKFDITAFSVSSAYGLCYLATLVNDEGYDFAGVTVTLEKDIDLTGVAWTPIGGTKGHPEGKTWICENPFKGTFDGQNNTISGLTINDEDSNYMGLFGYTDGNAVIKDVTLTSPSVIGKSNVGALVGHAHGSTQIENVTVTDPTVKGVDNVGGIVGGYFSSVVVSNVTVNGTISIQGNYKVGGVVGGGYGNIKGATVEGDSYTSSRIVAEYLEEDLEGDNVGGIIGFTGEGGYEYSGLTVKNVTVSGTRKVGGAIGYLNYNGAFVTNVTVEGAVVSNAKTPADYQKSKFNGLFVGAVIGEFANGCGAVTTVTANNVTVDAVFTYACGAQSNTKPSEVVGGSRGQGATIEITSATLDVDISSYIQIDSIVGGRIREVSVYTAEGLVFVNENYGEGKLIAKAREGLGLTINLLATINMDQIAAKTDAQGRQYNWVAMDGQFVTLNGNNYAIENMKAVADSSGKAGLFGYAGSNAIHNLTLENFTAYGTQVGTFSGHSLENQTITNSYLKGTVNLTWSRKNPVQDGAQFDEAYGGIGAITGINGANSSYGVTIVEGCVVTISFDGEFVSSFTNDGKYLVGFSAGEPNVGGAVNNGQIVIDQGADKTQYKPNQDGLNFVQVYSKEYNGEYVVYSAGGLAFFRDRVNAGVSYAGKTVALNNDIDLQEIGIGGGTNWTPIGTSTNPFYGTFDGRGYTISNLVNTSGKSELGLFGFASQWEYANGGQVVKAYIKNLKLENVTLKGESHVAGVVGTLVYGGLENITVSGNIHVEAKTHAAAVVGLCYGTLKEIHVDGANGAVAIDGDPSWNIHATVKIAGGIVGGFAGTGLSDLSAEHISVFVDGVNAENPGSTDVGYAGGIAGVVVEANVEASNLVVRDVMVGAGATNTAEEQQQKAAQNAGALLGAVVGGNLTLENYYVSTDSEIVDENQTVVTTEGHVEEKGNNAPVVGGTFTGITDENKIWLDDKTYEGLILVWKGVSSKVLQKIEVLNETGLGNLNTALAEGRSTDVYLMKSTYNMAGKTFISLTFSGYFHGNNATINFEGYQGLFSSLNAGAHVENLTLNVTNGRKVPVVETVNGSETQPVIIENVVVNGSLTNVRTVFVQTSKGVQKTESDGTLKEPELIIRNCTNNASVSNVGETDNNPGVSAFVDTSYYCSMLFENCTNTGALSNNTTTRESHGGAFIRYTMNDDGHVKISLIKCTNTGDITTHSKGDGRANVGGLIGTAHSAQLFYLEDCLNTGNITGYSEATTDLASNKATQTNVGGLIGRNNSTVTIVNCENRGNVAAYARENLDHAYAGGLIGCNGATVNGAKVSGSITANSVYGTQTAGALFGTGGTNSVIKDTVISVSVNPYSEKSYGLFGTNSAPVAGNVTNTTLTLVYASDEKGDAGFTQDFSWDANGNVTVGDYHIYNLAGLKFFRDSVNEGNNYKRATILLEAGFDLGGEEDSWAPIGFSNSEVSATFAGTFDGHGYTLTNLYITNLAPENHYNQHLGLFGRVESATICNLTIEDAYVFHNNSSQCVAVVVGESLPGARISNVVVKGTVVVKGFQYTGVIIGKGYVNVENCRVEANDRSYVENYWQYAGGIAGWLGEGSSSIIGCYTNIDIKVTRAGYSAIGAVSGIAHANNVIENCIIDGVTLTVERVFSGDDEDSNGVGAIAGRGGNNVTLRGNSGEVTVIADKSVRLNYHGLIGNAKKNIPLTGLTLENNDLKINWNNQYSYDNNVWTLGEGADLAKALENAQEGETYVLGEAHYTLSQSVSVDNVVIEGVEGTVIDVNPSEGKKTDITGNNVTLKGLTFKAEIGTNNSGSAVQVHGDSFTLENCTFDVAGTNYVSVQILSGAENVTIKGCHFNGGFKAIGSSYGTKDTTITIDHCTIENGTYGVHFDQTNGAKIVIKDCEIGAWTSFGSTGGGKVEVYNTYFKDGGSYNFFRPYVDTLLDNCTFDGGFKYDAGKAGITITVKNPTFNEEGKDMKNSVGNHTRFVLVVDGEETNMFAD